MSKNKRFHSWRCGAQVVGGKDWSASYPRFESNVQRLGLSFPQKQCSVPIFPIIVEIMIIFNSEGRMDHGDSIACCHDNVTITF